MKTTTAEVLEVKVETAQQLDDRLNDAVLNLQAVATRTRQHGILVTRLNPGHYTVSLSDTVPFGVTRELSR